MVHEGMGLHANTLPPNNVVMIAKYLVVAEILYVFNLVWTKLSILMMYYRIFHFAYFKLWAYIIGTFVICWVICITFLFVFICVPVQKLWYPYLEGRCISQVGTWIANAVSTIVTDLVILFLPIPQVWSLQLRRSEKLAVTLAFGLGFLYVSSPVCRSVVLLLTNLFQRRLCLGLPILGPLLLHHGRLVIHPRPDCRLDRHRDVGWHHIRLSADAATSPPGGRSSPSYPGHHAGSSPQSLHAVLQG